MSSAKHEPFHSLEWMHLLKDAEIEPELRALGFLMMAFADAKGEMFPSLARLALMTPAAQEGSTVSEKTIQRRRNKLVELEWIQRVEKGDGRGKASVYRLTFPTKNPDISRSETRTETRTTSLPETRTGVSDQERHEVITPRPLGKWSVEEGKVHPGTTDSLTTEHTESVSEQIPTTTDPPLPPGFRSWDQYNAAAASQKRFEAQLRDQAATNGNSAALPIQSVTAFTAGVSEVSPEELARIEQEHAKQSRLNAERAERAMKAFQ